MRHIAVQQHMIAIRHARNPRPQGLLQAAGPHHEKPGSRVALQNPGHGVDLHRQIVFRLQQSNGQYCGTMRAQERREDRGERQGATGLYDAILLGSRSLERREGRKVIIIVTDGDDTYSKTTSHQALEAAQLADATIYPVVVVPIANDAGRNIGGEHVLTFMAEGTGGRTFLPTLGAELDKAFSEIVTELRTQYMLGFYPHGAPPGKDRFHRLEVRVKSPQLRVSARNGYYRSEERRVGEEWR